MFKSDKSTEVVSLALRLVTSKEFGDLFKEGMALVEETATYLDGPGRQESKRLKRAVAFTYATESMRLTTRLMQLASWLLLARAVKEGEIPFKNFAKEKGKIRTLGSAVKESERESLQALPAVLLGLIVRSENLELRVRRMDSALDPSNAAAQAGESGEGHARGLQNLLRVSFGQT